jgi:hypothetical protein
MGHPADEYGQDRWSLHLVHVTEIDAHWISDHTIFDADFCGFPPFGLNTTARRMGHPGSLAPKLLGLVSEVSKPRKFQPSLAGTCSSSANVNQRFPNASQVRVEFLAGKCVRLLCQLYISFELDVL